MPLTPWQLKHPLPGSSSTPPYLYVARHFVSVVAESTHVRAHASELQLVCFGSHSLGPRCAGESAPGSLDGLFCMAGV